MGREPDAHHRDFVTNAGGYLDLVSDAITGLRDGFSGDASIWARLDTVWEKAQALGEKLYSFMMIQPMSL